MSDAEFQKHLAMLRRKMELLTLARKGSLEAKRVQVRAYHVRAYDVRAHTKIYWRRPEPSAESKKRHVPKLPAMKKAA